MVLSVTLSFMFYAFIRNSERFLKETNESALFVSVLEVLERGLFVCMCT